MSLFLNIRNSSHWEDESELSVPLSDEELSFLLPALKPVLGLLILDLVVFDLVLGLVVLIRFTLVSRLDLFLCLCDLILGFGLGLRSGLGLDLGVLVGLDLDLEMGLLGSSESDESISGDMKFLPMLGYIADN